MDAAGGARQAEVDVAVVGYGPIGALAAIMLGRRGFRVAIFDHWPEILDGADAAWFDGAEAVAVPLRPDWYVFGAAASTGEVPRLVGELQASLGARAASAPA